MFPAAVIYKVLPHYRAGRRLREISTVVVFAIIACLPIAAFARSSAQTDRACRLDSADNALLQQAAAAASSACQGAQTGTDAACQTAQAQWRAIEQDLCSSDPCTLDMPGIQIIENRVTAESIEGFLQVAAEISESGGGEIGSFRWMMNAQGGRTGGRMVRLTAQGLMTIPVAMPASIPPTDAALIVKAMRIIRRHEMRHRDAFYAVARNACVEMNQRTGDTNDILRKYFCETGPGSNAAEQQRVDLIDGTTKLVVAADGTKDIQTRSAYHDVDSYVTAGLCN